MKRPEIPRDFDREISEMRTRATALVIADSAYISFAVPPAAELPDVHVITTDQLGESDANARENRRRDQSTKGPRAG